MQEQNDLSMTVLPQIQQFSHLINCLNTFANNTSQNLIIFFSDCVIQLLSNQ